MTNADRLTTLRDLCARVEMAEGADNRLNGDLALAFGFIEAKTYRRGQGLYADRFYERARGIMPIYEAPAYTSSIDAAVGLVERLLPGQQWTLGRDLQHGHWVASLNALDEAGAPYSLSCWIANTSPLALLYALLTALISQEEQRNGEG